jgi:hypothetical protein
MKDVVCAAVVQAGSVVFDREKSIEKALGLISEASAPRIPKGLISAPGSA